MPTCYVLDNPRKSINKQWDFLPLAPCKAELHEPATDKEGNCPICWRGNLKVQPQVSVCKERKEYQCSRCKAIFYKEWTRQGNSVLILFELGPKANYYWQKHSKVMPNIVEPETIQIAGPKPFVCEFCHAIPEYSKVTRCYFCGRTMCSMHLNIIREDELFHDACPECYEHKSLTVNNPTVKKVLQTGMFAWLFSWGNRK